MLALYQWVKTLHLVWLIAWMAAVFYLPRLLINAVEAGPDEAITARLALMGRRLYRFGHVMFALTLSFGVFLWFGYCVLERFPTMVGRHAVWIHLKLALVCLLFCHYIVAGYWLKQLARGQALPSARALRWFNEVPVLLLIVVVWLAFAKPASLSWFS